MKSQMQVGTLVYCAYIVKNGKRIYPKNGKCFVFTVAAKEQA